MKPKLIAFILAVGALSLLFSGCSEASKKARHQQRADAHFKAGDYDRAELEYLNLLRLDPTNRVAQRNLALMFFAQGRLVRAHAVLSEVSKTDPEDYEIRIKHAMSLLTVGQSKEAREEVLRVLAQQPTNSEALLLLADSSLTTNDLADARQQLTRLKSASEGLAAYHVAWGMLELRNRDTNAAAESFRAALAREPESSAAHMAMGGLHALLDDPTNALAEFKLAAELAPVRSPVRLRYVEYLMARGDADGARRVLEELSKDAPDYLPALTRLAQIALTERRFAEAEGALKSVLARDPHHIDAMLMMVRLRMTQNQPDQAIVELERALKVFPRLPQLHYQMAIVRLAQNDLAGAARSLNEAITLRPDYGEAVLLQAELNIRRGNLAPAVEALTKLTTERPGVSSAQLLLAAAHRAAGRPEVALGIYERLSRSFPTNPQPAFLMGIIHRQQERSADARRSFERALSYVPGFLPAVEQLINLDLAEKKFADARARAQAEVDRSPTNTASYMLLSQVHLAETNLTAAESVLLKAQELAPDSNSVKSLLARVYVVAGKHEDALVRFQEIVKRNTNDVASWLMIAELNSAATNYGAARDAYEGALAANPRSSTSLNNLAWLYSEHLNDPKRAYELAAKARELEPQSPYVADTFGWVLYKLGDYPRALTMLLESARQLPEQPDVLFHLGMTHYMMGEESAARVALQSASQLAGADAKWKPEAQESLRVLNVDPATAGAAVVKELETLAARQSRDPILLARLAAFAEREADWTKAAGLYEKALQVNSNLVPVMVRLAQLYSAHPRNPERAFAIARRARSLEPNDPKIAHTLGRLAYDSAQSGPDFQWAYSLLQESARASSGPPEVWFDLALATYALGDVTNAVNAMRKATDSGVTGARQEEAGRFLEMNRLAVNPEQAVASTASVAALLQKQPDYAPALVVSGVIAEKRGDYAAARDAYERVLRIFPAFTPATKPLAILYGNHLKDPTKAYEFASRAREAFPQDRQVARVLGGLAFQRGEFPRAVQLLRESAPAFSQDAELFYLLGQAHYKLKQSNESKEALTNALALAPGSSHATEARRILAELK